MNFFSERGEREPEDFILNYGPLVRPGTDVLDAAAGTGRHSLFFARRGCRVFAIERQREYVDRLRELGIDSAEGDAENMTLLPNRFDAVVNTFFLHRPLLGQYLATLRPNGLLFFRTFTVAHRDLLGHQKPGRDFLLQPGELREIFKDMEIIHYNEASGPERAIATIVARKPAV
jgi:SAM-dependent methyltransferase